jgi:DNA mismatch repair protein MutS
MHGAIKDKVGKDQAGRDPAAGATPAMAQWFAAKAAHPDALLFFRMGDFYELFFADAEAAATALDIALTHRGSHAGAPIPMCGVPVHAAEAYLVRLIRRGFRVAVAEQMEAAGKARPGAKAAKAPIHRAVVRLVTPGTLTEDTLLEPGRPNLLLALAELGDALGAAWLDISTGLFETAALARAELAPLLARLDPAEVLAPAGLDLGDYQGRRSPGLLTSPPLAARRHVAEAFGVGSLDAFGRFSDAEAVAANLAIDYVRAAGAGALPHLGRPVPQQNAGVMLLDAATRASLEITRARDGGPHPLLAAFQQTRPPAGARLLAARLAAPLTDPAAIAARQDAWGCLVAEPAAAAALRLALRRAPDIARALGRLSVGRGTPRDLAALRDGIAAAAAAAAALPPALPAELAAAAAALALDPALGATLTAALADPAPARLEDGGAIRPGYDSALDAEIALRDDTRRVVAAMQLDLSQRYRVASLKIRHHAQLGYVIEVPAAATEALRAFPELSLRQGMANGARFSHPELAELDRRITEAAERAAAREKAVFAHLVQTALAAIAALAGAAQALAVLDVAQSAAGLAAPGTWCRPRVTEDAAFCIRGGRHPVVERNDRARFVPNDCDLSPDRRVLLLTGPNMAGKSTFLRQNALIAILAQCGLPVPAASAEIGVVDRLFSRVGAADDLARGRSTFMVEMTETAAILNQAGPRSLVVVDEIGRGTSTLDGLAIAWAVLEALHTQIRGRTIFATHFHELAALSEQLPRLAVHCMRVREWKGGVVFLHEVAAGAAGRSWGVHVAELAGVPAPVVRRAAALLAGLEREGRRSLAPAELPLFAAAPAAPEPASPDALHAAVAALDLDRMTPREAMDRLYQLKALLPVTGEANTVPSA